MPTPNQRQATAQKAVLRGSATAALRAQKKDVERRFGASVVEAISHASRRQVECEAELDMQNPDRHRRLKRKKR